LISRIWEATTHSPTSSPFSKLAQTQLHQNKNMWVATGLQLFTLQNCFCLGGFVEILGVLQLHCPESVLISFHVLILGRQSWQCLSSPSWPTPIYRYPTGLENPKIRGNSWFLDFLKSAVKSLFK
jgi:hypothetical protein